MDFDDLDDAIEARIAEEGTLTGALAALAGPLRPKPGKYAPRTYMPSIPRNERLSPYTMSADERKVSLRAFLFHGPGDTAGSWATVMSGAPNWLELAVHEWPSHGARSSEPACQSLDELAGDAFQAVKDAMEQVASGALHEGAPFALIGHGVGAQVVAILAARLRFELGLDPAAVVVLDRAPPDVPLLSAKGAELLSKSPEEFVKSFHPTLAKEAMASEKGMQAVHSWLQDIKLCGETRDDDFHKFECDVLVLRPTGAAKTDDLGRLSMSFQELVVKLEGQEATLTVPVKSTTKASELKSAFAKATKVDAKELSFVVQQGTDQRVLADNDAVGSSVTIRGLKSLKPVPHQWAHPVCCIGCGYNGLKMAMEYIRCGNENIVLFDRNDRVGGFAWIHAANKHSKLQTEWSSFHVWWGPEFNEDARGGWPVGWDTHTKKPQVLEHFQKAAENWGILAHCRLQTNVTEMEIVGGKDKLDRYYKLTVESLKGEPAQTVKVSVMYNYPGAMVRNRIIDYPGEDTFGGQIAYGMMSDYVYDERMKGQTIAILGNGAFAVENVRTCVEHAAGKVYLVTRRKNLPSPRVPCWFVHRGPVPTPGRLVLEMFEPAYKLCGLGDPWGYWSVHASKDHQKVSIIQASRFGIGDVTFLAVAYGKLEYVEDVLERCSKNTLHLKSGRKLTPVHGIIKSLGLLGDHGVDKLHHMKTMVGMFCEGDYRRVISFDATGMNAANFTTFSLGIGVHGMVRNYKYLHDFPQEYFRAEEAGLLTTLPRSKADEKLDKPAYMCDVKFAMTSGIMLEGFVPRMGTTLTTQGWYKYILYSQVHPTDQFLEYCLADWNKYQEMFKEQGCTHEYIEYPYTKEMIQGFVEDYNRSLGTNISLDGPGPDERQAMLKQVELDFLKSDFAMTKDLLTSSLHRDLKVDPDALLGIKAMHSAREQLTGSAPGCALDFDQDKLAAWSNWTSGKCTVEDIPDADQSTLKGNPKALEVLYAFLEKKKAPKPTAV